MFGDEFNSGSPYTAFCWDGINKFENEPPSNHPFPPIQSWSGKGAAYTNGAAVGTQNWFNSMVHAGLYAAHHALPSPWFIERHGRDRNRYDPRDIIDPLPDDIANNNRLWQQELKSAKQVLPEMLKQKKRAIKAYQRANSMLQCMQHAKPKIVRHYTKNVEEARSTMNDAIENAESGRQEVDRKSVV